MYLLSSYRFICYCALPSAYLVKDKDIKSYLCFQILCLYFIHHFTIAQNYVMIFLPMSPADLRRRATRTTNKKHLRNNAALCIICGRQCSSCCWPFVCVNLRNLRNLRENNHASILNLLPKQKPQCLPQISQITQTNPKTTSTTNCLSLRPLRYLRENNTQEDSRYL